MSASHPAPSKRQRVTGGRNDAIDVGWGCILIGSACLIGLCALFYYFTKVMLCIAAAVVVWLIWLGIEHKFAKRRAVNRFCKRWSREGRDMLIVTSNSRHWRDYIEQNWIHRWRTRAVLLNWSERKAWPAHAPEVALYQRFAANHDEYKPVVLIVSKRDRNVAVVPFYKAFKQLRVGNPQLLQARELELVALLAKQDAAA